MRFVSEGFVAPSGNLKHPQNGTCRGARVGTRLSLWGRLSPTNLPGDRVIQVLFGMGALHLGLAEYVDGALALGSVGNR